MPVARSSVRLSALCGPLEDLVPFTSLTKSGNTATGRMLPGNYKGNEFQPKWSQAKVARIAYLTGLGRSSSAIAEELGDGTHPASIRAQWVRWGIGYDGKGRRNMIPTPVPLNKWERRMILDRAAKQGITPQEWLRRIAAAAIKDDLYAAVVDEG